jgi:hypothetical protein
MEYLRKPGHTAGCLLGSHGIVSGLLMIIRGRDYRRVIGFWQPGGLNPWLLSCGSVFYGWVLDSGDLNSTPRATEDRRPALEAGHTALPGPPRFTSEASRFAPDQGLGQVSSKIQPVQAEATIRSVPRGHLGSSEAWKWPLAISDVVSQLGTSLVMTTGNL